MKRGSITRKILVGLLITGAVTIAMTSPYFFINIARYYARHGWGEIDKRKRKQISDMYSYLRRSGYIEYEVKNKQIHIKLTKEGKKKAGKLQINDLKVKKPKSWDMRWRIVMFDIKEEDRMKRDALRGKLKELNFYKIQKSVWVHPYACHSEIEILRKFFNLKHEKLTLIESKNLGRHESFARKHFSICAHKQHC